MKRALIAFLPFCLCTHLVAADKAKPPQVVNVRDFGAQADGKSDDAPAIQRAIEQVAKTGGRVSLPAAPKPYIIRTSLVISADNIELYGPGATIKLADETSGGKIIDCIIIEGTEKKPVSGVRIHGLTIDANYWKQTGSANPRGIDSDWATKLVIEKVTIKRPFVGLTFGLGVTHSEARDCTVNQWHNDAFDVSGDAKTGSTHHIRFIRCLARKSPNETDGGLAGRRNNAWEIEDGCNDVELVDCVVEDAGGTGFGVRNHGWPHAVATRRISFTRCRTKNVRSGWVVRGTDHQVTVSGVKLIKCQTDAVGSTFTQGVGGIEITDSSFTGLLLLGMRGTQAAELEIADRPARDVIISNTSIGRFKANLKPGNNGKMDYQPTAQLINVKAESAQVFGGLQSLKAKDCQFETPLKHGGQP
ncbi:MAG: glycosyl hydrolase family 28-related protein [Verrucomicrobiota bacterium]|jgi:hypothetical protein|nr:glycosyl hydrolase family 28-related protein [Verrucomicrobiota bacterium]